MNDAYLKKRKKIEVNNVSILDINYYLSLMKFGKLLITQLHDN